MARTRHGERAVVAPYHEFARLPASLSAAHRAFTFYFGDPISWIPAFLIHSRRRATRAARMQFSNQN